MGAKKTKTRTRTRTRTNTVKANCNVYKNQVNKYKKSVNYWKKKESALKKKYFDLQTNYRQLKKTSVNPGKLKEKAKEVFGLLENQYIDRLDRIKTQQNLMNKQTSLINAREDTIEKQKKALDDQNDKLHTRSRLLIYDERDDRVKRLVETGLKYFTMLLIILIVALLFMKN